MNMRNRFNLYLAALAAACILGCGLASAQSDEDEEDAPEASTARGLPNQQFPWPSQFSADGQSFTLYPPELERWDGDTLQARGAVSVQAGSDSKPVYGVAELVARVEVDNASQLATVREIRVTRVNFPTAPQEAQRYLELLRPQFAAVTWQVPAEQLRAELTVERTARTTHAQPVRNEPPTVIFSDRPAILVPIDGAPVLRDMVGLGVKRVLNTRALILQDRDSDRYFIYVAGRWMESRKLDGPWTDAQIRPSALDEARQQAQTNGQVDLLDTDNRASGTTRIFVTTTPTELVQTDGPPQYSPVGGTQLLYVTNTPNRLFLDLRTQQYYVLLAGRWFRTRALDQGRWEYVAGSALPSDFAAIPENHPTASVRESVPGTPQAQEAAIANSVPQVATVSRAQAQLDVTYDGSPQFKPIEGTSLEYAVNAPVPVIRIDDHNYYALDNGVWFYSATVDGPWSPAGYVPAIIYTIPRSSPLHYVTYVRVYDATSDSVSVGYSPGYVGSYVTPEDTVVYGSGYYYRPWVGSAWYGYPVTWGFGFSYWNTWWNPWPWWRTRWAFRPVPCFHPWWGPWHRTFVAPRTVIVAPSVAVLPPGHVAVTRGNVTHIYQRWGRNIATPHAAMPVPVPHARAAAVGPGSATEARIFRNRDVDAQRFTGTGQSENGRQRWQRDEPAQQGRVVPAPAGASAPNGVPVPRHDRRRSAESANASSDPQANMPRPIVGAPPGTSTPDAGRAVRSAPGTGARPIVGPPPRLPNAQPGNVVPGQPSTARPIVGPPPGIPNSNPGANDAPAERRHGDRSDRGRSAGGGVLNQPSGAVRQRFEERGASPHAFPVPVPRAVPGGRVDGGMSGRMPHPAVMSPPQMNGHGAREERGASGRGNDGRGGGHGGRRDGDR
jgi:hypothetical protein